MAEEKKRGLDSLQPYLSFREKTERHKDKLIATLSGIRQEGKKLLGYGASTKGNVMLQFCGLGPAEIPCIAEVNEDKFGAFTPGTRIPIVSEADARKMGPDYFFVLPWHFKNGIVERAGLPEFGRQTALSLAGNRNRCRPNQIGKPGTAVYPSRRKVDSNPKNPWVKKLDLHLPRNNGKAGARGTGRP